MKNLFLLIALFSSAAASKEALLVDSNGNNRGTILQPVKRSWGELKNLMENNYLKDSFNGLVDCNESVLASKTAEYAQNILYN